MSAWQDGNSPGTISSGMSHPTHVTELLRRGEYEVKWPLRCGNMPSCYLEILGSTMLYRQTQSVAQVGERRGQKHGERLPP
jgi:hypothetical protein